MRLAPSSLGVPLGSEEVTVMMGNSAHLSLANNAIYSSYRLGRSHNTMMFGLDDGVCSSGGYMMLDASSTVSTVPCYALPKANLGLLCGSKCGENVDVWSKGFADVAVIKPAVILAVVELGYDVLWMDTDIVLLSDPGGFWESGR